MNFIKRALSYLNDERGYLGRRAYERRQAERDRARLAQMGEWTRQQQAQQQAQQQRSRATAAMQATQQRAAADRARALAGIRMAQQQAMAAWQTQQQQSMAAMQPWQQQIQALQAQPETIGAAEAGQIFEAGRTPVEAGTQALMRGMQEQYAPGGFRRGAMQQAMQSQIGQMGGMRQKIALERTLRRRQDLMALMGQQAQYGQAMAGLGTQRAMGLAGIYGQTGRSLAQLYGQTISAVPQYGGGTTPFQSPYPYQQG